MLRGDLNEVQQLALSFYLGDTDRRKAEREWTLFKMYTMVLRPDLGKKLQEQEDHYDPNEFAPVLSEEEMESYQPLSGEEIGAALELFEGFGLTMDGAGDEGLREV